MAKRALALKESLGSWDDVSRAVDQALGGRAEERPTKEALRLASLGKGGSNVAAAIARAAHLMLGEAAPKESHEVVRLADPMGPGRWRELAARYRTFRRQATLSHAAGASEVALDAAADELGVHKGEGPTEDECQAAIERAVMDIDVLRKRFGARSPAEIDPSGREATSADFAPATEPDKTLRPRDKVKLGRKG